jgi:hypothetical protein
MLLQLAIIGILIALLPLSYVMVRGSRDKYRKLVWITAFLTLDLIMFGASRADRFRPGLPGLAGLLRPFQSARGDGADPRGRNGAAERPGHAGQGVDRDDPSLFRHGGRRADHLADGAGMGQAARTEAVAVVRHRRVPAGLPAGRVRHAGP